MPLGQGEHVVAHADHGHEGTAAEPAHHHAAGGELPNHGSAPGRRGTNLTPATVSSPSPRKRTSRSRPSRSTGHTSVPPGASWRIRAGGGSGRGAGGDRDAVERRAVRRAEDAVPVAHLHVPVAQPGQAVACLAGEREMALHRHHLRAEPGEHGRGVARPGAHLQHRLGSAQLQELGHARHDPGLRDRLARPDGERAVVIGAPPLVLRHEQLARHLGHGRQDSLVVDPAAAELPPHHALARVSGCSCGALPVHARSPCRARA